MDPLSGGVRCCSRDKIDKMVGFHALTRYTRLATLHFRDAWAPRHTQTQMHGVR